MATRNMLFVSHANPEDNVFARWLALRLAREGYPVWCDLTQLLGGEDFWRDIEVAIRDRTLKFLFVLSKISNRKQGPLNELAVAKKIGKKLHDFVLPLRIDDIRSDDMNIELNRLNYVDFAKGWESGYALLLELLENEGIPCDSRFSPDAVTTWWRTHYPASAGLIATPERYLSNWFEFSQFPKKLRLHSIEPRNSFEDAVKEETLELPVPAKPHANGLFSFAAGDELLPTLESKGMEIVNSAELEFEKFRDNGLDHPTIKRREARNILSALFREAFDGFAIDRGLLSYELSGGAKYYWFKQGTLENDRIFYQKLTGDRSWRAMVGFKSLAAKAGSTRIRNWHFGISARTYFWPFAGLAVRGHVAFTENGVLYESKSKQHAARRNQCKSWH